MWNTEKPFITHAERDVHNFADIMQGLLAVNVELNCSEKK